MERAHPSPFARLRVRDLAGLYLLFAVVALALVGGFDATTHRRVGMRVLAVMLTAVMGLPVLVLGYRAGLKWRRLFGEAFQRSDLPLITVVVPVVLTTMAAVYIVYVPVSYLAPDFVRRHVLDLAMFDVDTVGQWTVLALGTVVLAPVIEEVLFRGLIMQRWAYRWGTRTGVMASSALFAVGHGEWVGHFLFGVAMSLLYLRTRRLWVPIAAHGVHNFALTVPLLWQLLTHGAHEPTETLASFRADWWVGYPTLAAAVLLGWIYFRLYWPAGSVRAALNGPTPYDLALEPTSCSDEAAAGGRAPAGEATQ